MSDNANIGDIETSLNLLRAAAEMNPAALECVTLRLISAYAEIAEVRDQSRKAGLLALDTSACETLVVLSSVITILRVARTGTGTK